MPVAVRVAVVLVVLGVWAIVVGAQLVAFFLGRTDDLPSVVLLGVPSAVLLAVSPLPSRRDAVAAKAPTVKARPKRTHPGAGGRR